VDTRFNPGRNVALSLPGNCLYAEIVYEKEAYRVLILIVCANCSRT